MVLKRLTALPILNVTEPLCEPVAPVLDALKESVDGGQYQPEQTGKRLAGASKKSPLEPLSMKLFDRVDPLNLVMNSPFMSAG